MRVVTFTHVLLHAGDSRLVVLCCTPPQPPADPAHSRPVGPPGTGLVVRAEGCCGDLPEYRALDLLRVGVRRLVVWSGECATPHRCRAWVARLRALVGPVIEAAAAGEPIPARVPVLTLGTQTAPAVGRRAMLGLRRPPLPAHDPAHDDQDRLLVSLTALGLSPVEAGPPAGVLLEVEGCVACGVCVRACPHQALELSMLDDLALLRHHPAACRGDRACVATCPPGAISVRQQAGWADVLADREAPLARVPVRRCARCRGLMPASADGDLCAVCAERRRNPFGSVLPR